MDGPNTDILSRILDIWLGRLLVLLHRHRLLLTPKRPTRLLWRDPLDAVVMWDRMLNNHSSQKPDEPRARECLGYNRLEGNGTSRPERLLIWEVLGGHLFTTDNSTLRGTDNTQLLCLAAVIDSAVISWALPGISNGSRQLGLQGQRLLSLPVSYQFRYLPQRFGRRLHCETKRIYQVDW
jgi:hypothetical protein